MPEFKDYGFDSECLLDFGTQPIEKLLNDVEMKIKSGQIEIKGQLPVLKMKAIYQLIHSSKFYSYHLKSKIKNSLNQIGLTGLPDPQRPKRRS